MIPCQFCYYHPIWFVFSYIASDAIIPQNFTLILNLRKNDQDMVACYRSWLYRYIAMNLLQCGDGENQQQRNLYHDVKKYVDQELLIKKSRYTSTSLTKILNNLPLIVNITMDQGTNAVIGIVVIMLLVGAVGITMVTFMMEAEAIPYKSFGSFYHNKRCAGYPG